MSDKEIRSILVVVTPDGRRHGQRLTDDEAVELCKRLLEVRGQAEPEPKPKPKPKPKAKPKPKPKAKREPKAKRASGGGRKPVRLDGPEMSRVIAMRQSGMSVTAIARETHHGMQVVRRALAEMGGE